jgi:hypothetical protein
LGAYLTYQSGKREGEEEKKVFLDDLMREGSCYERVILASTFLYFQFSSLFSPPILLTVVEKTFAILVYML